MPAAGAFSMRAAIGPARFYNAHGWHANKKVSADAHSDKGTHMEPNPQFTITRTLRPCRVTRSLLLDLERNISATLADIAGDADKPSKATSLSIVDADGEEVLASAEQIAGDQLPNSTKQVQLEMSVKTSGEQKARIVLTVRLVFITRSLPTLRIILQCPRARDQADGLEGRVMRLMDNSLDESRFFHPSLNMVGFLGAMGVMGGVLWFAFSVAVIWQRQFSNLAADWYVIATATLFTLWAYLYVCSEYFPACAFDTKRRAELDERKAWAKKAIWSLFGVNLLVLTVGGFLLQKVRSYLGF